MAQSSDKLTDRLFHLREMRKWARAARQASKTGTSKLLRQRDRARALRAQLDRLIRQADERLAYPRVGADKISKPHSADWAWRPDLWRAALSVPGISAVRSGARLSPDVSLYHDCSFSELTLRQVRNTREEDLAPFGLRMDVFRFSGSFLSAALTLPPEALDGLRRKHVIRLEMIVESEKPQELFVRLNVKNGPNTEQLVREVNKSLREPVVEFDLAYTEMNEKRVEHAWIDLIFESPEMNQVTLRDLTVIRRVRAEL